MTEGSGYTVVVTLCPAKINLLLRILAREDTGYHQIETMFQALWFHDRLTVRWAGAAGGASETTTDGETVRVMDGVTLRVELWDYTPETSDIVGDLGDPSSNTVARAARSFFAASGRSATAVDPLGVSIRLQKAIPAGTGLGGASSDAAGALMALNVLYDSPLTDEQLVEIGGRIGADVPFFLSGSPTAVAWGRGDRVLSLRAREFAHVVLAIPSERVSTADAYRELSASLTLPAPACWLPDLDLCQWQALGNIQHNDFEDIVFRRIPVAASVRRALVAHGAIAAGLSGSGSAVFGVFKREEDARYSAASINDAHGDAVRALVVPVAEIVSSPSGFVVAPPAFR